MRLEVGSAYTLVFLAVILPVLWALQALEAAKLVQKRYANSDMTPAHFHRATRHGPRAAFSPKAEPS